MEKLRKRREKKLLNKEKTKKKLEKRREKKLLNKEKEESEQKIEQKKAEMRLPEASVG
jgi:hypothetical protein